MKNKKVLYLLIPAVLFVWGLVIFQVISYFDTPEFQFTSSSNIKITEEEIQSPDTFELLGNYRDPFHFTKYSSNTSLKNENVANRKAPKRVDNRRYVRRHWGKINYQGQIEGKKGKIGLIWIAGKNYLLRESEEKNGYKVEFLAEDSVVILYSEEKRTFLKSQRN